MVIATVFTSAGAASRWHQNAVAAKRPNRCGSRVSNHMPARKAPMPKISVAVAKAGLSPRSNSACNPPAPVSPMAMLLAEAVAE